MITDGHNIEVYISSFTAIEDQVLIFIAILLDWIEPSAYREQGKVNSLP